jgi:Uri superfamily endonuclease
MMIKTPALQKIEGGIYLLVIKLKGSHTISAGKLPETTFREGIYLYVGRARRGLKERLKRHLRKEKKLFWHVDYLLQKAEIDEIWIKRDSLDECRLVLDIKNTLESSLHPLKKFGSSDCACISHLFYLPENKSDLNSIRKQLSFERIDIHGNQI